MLTLRGHGCYLLVYTTVVQYCIHSYKKKSNPGFGVIHATLITTHKGFGVQYVVSLKCIVHYVTIVSYQFPFKKRVPFCIALHNSLNLM